MDLEKLEDLDPGVRGNMTASQALIHSWCEFTDIPCVHQTQQRSLIRSSYKKLRKAKIAEKNRWNNKIECLLYDLMATILR